MRSSALDKQLLAIRNREAAAAMHSESLKEKIRRLLLVDFAQLPISQLTGTHNRILVIRPDHLGDVLLTVPAFRALRRQHPNAEIHALVGPWSAEVLAPVNEVDLVLTVPFPGFTRDGKSSLIKPYVLAHTTARKLRRIGYDSVYILRRDHWWGALVAHLAGIPNRVGYDLPDSNLFLNRKVAYQRDHAVRENLRLISADAAANPPSQINYPVFEDARIAIHDLFHENRINRQNPFFVLHVGSGSPIKNWDDEKWAKVADAIADGLGGTAILTGSPAERATAERIASHMKNPAAILAGATDLPGLAALLSEAKLTLGSDSGPLHLAAAVGTPTVALFGPADPAEFSPWGNPERQRVLTSDIACRPCRILDWSGDDLSFHPCVRDITPMQVIDAAWRAMNAAAIPE